MGKYDFAFDLYEDSPLAWIARTVEPESIVLEFGSANGRLTKYLHLEKKCNIDIVEIDEISGKEASIYASHAYLGIENGDIEKYYWTHTDVKYDYIIFADVLEHLFNPREVLNRCKAVIKIQGKILVSIPNISHNSIIIDLINDRFNYTSVGLLDNTHIKFFTRQSFIKMAEEVGWAIVNEYIKNIRVGDNEIPNSYEDIPKEVAKVLKNRDMGNVYQYMFILMRSPEYICGNIERIISFDASSYYYAEIFFEYQGEFNYKHSANKHINPCNKENNLFFPVLANCHKAKINLLNCNAILKINNLYVISGEHKHMIAGFEHNGNLINGVYFFMDSAPEIYIHLRGDEKQLEVSFTILQYDFDKAIFQGLTNNCLQLQMQIKELQELYKQSQEEIVLLKQNDEQLQNSVKTYEEQISKKDAEYLESVKIYEEQISKKDAEFMESVKTYEEQISKKDAEFIESVKTYENVMQQKEKYFQETIESYKKMLQQKNIDSGKQEKNHKGLWGKNNV